SSTARLSAACAAIGCFLAASSEPRMKCSRGSSGNLSSCSSTNSSSPPSADCSAATSCSIVSSSHSGMAAPLAKFGELRTQTQQGLAVDLRNAAFADAQQFPNDRETDILRVMLTQDECLAFGKCIDLLPKAVLHFPKGQAVICGRRGVRDRLGTLCALVEHDTENQRRGKARQGLQGIALTVGLAAIRCQRAEPVSFGSPAIACLRPAFAHFGHAARNLPLDAQANETLERRASRWIEPVDGLQQRLEGELLQIAKFEIHSPALPEFHTRKPHRKEPVMFEQELAALAVPALQVISPERR